MRSVVLPVAGLALALSLLGRPSLWELDLARLASEPWRLVTGHLVHWSPEHLLWDLAVFVGLGLACEMASRRRTALSLGLAAALIGLLAPLATPGLEVYRGLSGLDAALYALLAARCLRGATWTARVAGLLALVGFLGKVGWEVVTGSPLFVSHLSEVEGVFVVPAAHLLGGLAGLLAGWVGDGWLGLCTRKTPEDSWISGPPTQKRSRPRWAFSGRPAGPSCWATPSAAPSKPSSPRPG